MTTVTCASALGAAVCELSIKEHFAQAIYLQCTFSGRSMLRLWIYRDGPHQPKKRPFSLTRLTMDDMRSVRGSVDVLLDNLRLCFKDPARGEEAVREFMKRMDAWDDRAATNEQEIATFWAERMQAVLLDF